MIIDCHYCEYATCENPTSWCNCNVEDGGYFDHEVKDSKKEAVEYLQRVRENINEWMQEYDVEER